MILIREKGSVVLVEIWHGLDRYDAMDLYKTCGGLLATRRIPVIHCLGFGLEDLGEDGQTALLLLASVAYALRTRLGVIGWAMKMSPLMANYIGKENFFADESTALKDLNTAA